MSTTFTDTEKTVTIAKKGIARGKVLNFSLAYEGYWTGDMECACFADHPEPCKQNQDSRQYIELPLSENKRYRVTMQVEAEELDEGSQEKIDG